METLSTPEKSVFFAEKQNSDRVDVGIIVVSWNVKQALIQNLASLYRSQGTISARIIVVDNASSDGTMDQVAAKFPGVTQIVNSANLGFAKAVNQGIDLSNSRHVLLFNPDMTMTPDALQKTVDYLDRHPDVGVLGARLLRQDGTVLPSVRRLPDVLSQIAIMTKLSKIFPALTTSYLLKDFDYDEEQEAPSVRGAYFAISENALKKIPRLDERYFIWFEEVDYCSAISKTGLKVMFVPSIQATDLYGQSFKQRSLYWKQKNFTRSIEQYFWKWQPGIGAAVISCLRPIVLAAAWICNKIV